MQTDAINRSRTMVPKRESGDAPRFSALEWLTIATLAQATPGRDADLLHNLRALYGQCESDPDRARLDGLIGMAALIGAVGPDAFASRLDKFLSAGFSSDHLQLLGDSLARQTQTFQGSPRSG